MALALCASMLLVPALFLAKHGTAVRRTNVRAGAAADLAAAGSHDEAARATRSQDRFEDTAAATAAGTTVLPVDDSGDIGNATLTVLQVEAPTTTSPPTTAKPVTTTTRPKPVTTTTARPKPVTTTTTAPPAPKNQQTGGASWYQTYNGTCAHRTLPFGTIVTVTNLANGQQVTCRVADRGPAVDGRIIDLDKETFEQIASSSAGVIDVRIEW